MPGAKHSDEERKKLRILDMFEKGASTKYLAEKFEISENTIKSWVKRTGTKRLQPVKKGAPKKSEKGAKKGAKQNRRGAPKNNSNAVGKSSGAPFGNHNALVHGGYSPAYWDTLTETEQQAIAGIGDDPERHLTDEINLLTIQESRIMKKINHFNEIKSGQAVTATVRSETKRAFESKNEKNEYERIQREKVEAGEILPGTPYSLTIRTEATYEIVRRLQEALTRCQAQKQRCLQILVQLRLARGDDGRKAPESNLLEALVQNTAEEIDTHDIPEILEATEHSDDLVEQAGSEQA